MSTIPLQRQYYKLFTGSEQNGGHDKIQLGYQANTREVVLKKDASTTFHFPYFAEQVSIATSGLIEAGAIAGPIPAMADRLISYQKGYSTHTPWGSTSYMQDGELFYSWLRSVSGEEPIWMDRYFYPGALSAESNVIGQYNSSVYISQGGDGFVDVVSERMLESGNLYEYFHVGEESASLHIDTLSGNDTLSALRLHYTTWDDGSIDTSGFSNKLQVIGDSNLMMGTQTRVNEVDRQYLDFSNQSYAEFKIIHSDIYNTQSFTMMCWVKSDEWQSINTSQIVGNMFDGGYSLRFENLIYTPYFFIAESTHSNLFCFNNKAHNYTSPNLHTSLGTNIKDYAVDGERVLVILDDKNHTLIKVDHLGNSKRNTIKFTEESDLECYRIFVDKDNNYIITTNKYIITVSNDLDKDSIKLEPRICSQLTSIVFNFQNNIHIFDLYINSLFIGDDFYHLSKDFFLYKNHIKINTLSRVTNFNVDPEGYIWAVHEVNKVSKLAKDNSSLIFTVELGDITGVLNNNSIQQSISFIYRHKRSTNENLWYAAVLSSFDKRVYFINSQGGLQKSLYLPYRVGDKVLREDIEVITTADFSGYNWSRVFNTVKFNDKKSLAFDISMLDVVKENFKTYSLRLDSELLKVDQWHHICVTFDKNKAFLYLDGIERDSIKVPPRYFLTFDKCNSLYVGTPNGKYSNLNAELDVKDIIYNGCFDDLRFYNYVVPQKYLPIFQRAYLKCKDMIWDVFTSKIQFIDTIERVFKNQLTGSKSQFYKLHITGFDTSKLTDSNSVKAKELVESYIRQSLAKVAPAHSELLKIEWD